jgi:hypothetical protein
MGNLARFGPRAKKQSGVAGPHAQQVAELRAKCQAYKARASALTSELTALRLEAADREAAPAPGGAARRLLTMAAANGAAAAAAADSRGDLMAAISAMRMRQEAYLAACCE